MTFHGSDLQGIVGADGSYHRASGPLRVLSRFAARRARENIVVSRRLLDFLPPLRRAAHVLPLGVDFERFHLVPREEARRELQLPPDARLVLFAANPTNAVKRFELAQAAVEEANRLGMQDGWNEPAQLITLTGQSHDRVPLYMNACDALLLTSRHEGSPTVVKESLVCNLPVVSTDVGDVRERLQNIAGCSVCEATPEALGKALRDTLMQPQRLEARKALEHLDERRVVERVLEVYAAALQRK
jgi:glycosyltransferase involved in cell wall biosynthesis